MDPEGNYTLSAFHTYEHKFQNTRTLSKTLQTWVRAITEIFEVGIFKEQFVWLYCCPKVNSTDFCWLLCEWS